jgi:hypothetical protein
MIKTLLRHSIYEICIDVFFNKIIQNFSYKNGIRDRLVRTYYKLMEKYTNNTSRDMIEYEQFVKNTNFLTVAELKREIICMRRVLGEISYFYAHGNKRLRT